MARGAVRAGRRFDAGLIASVVLQITGREISVEEPHQAYGRLDIPGGHLFIDVGRVRIGADAVGQLFLQDGRYELHVEADASVSARLVTLGGALEGSPGTVAGIAVLGDGSTVVEVETGQVSLKWFDEGLQTLDVGAGSSARLDLDGSITGPSDTADLAPAKAANAIAPARVALEAILKQRQARLEHLTGARDGETPLAPSELQLASELFQCTRSFLGEFPDTEAVREARRLLGAEAAPPPSAPEAAATAPASFFGRKLPFGPFLSLAALEFLFFGPQIIDWYVATLGSGY